VPNNKVSRSSAAGPILQDRLLQQARGHKHDLAPGGQLPPGALSHALHHLLKTADLQ
jgi:hypothetical protein